MDAHEVLGVDHDAGPEAIRNAYRRRARMFHPDRWSFDEDLRLEAERLMRDLNQAVHDLGSGQVSRPNRRDNTESDLEVVYDIREWRSDEVRALVALLGAASVPFELAGSELVVDKIDERCVDLAVLAIRGERTHWG